MRKIAIMSLMLIGDFCAGLFDDVFWAVIL